MKRTTKSVIAVVLAVAMAATVLMGISSNRFDSSDANTYTPEYTVMKVGIHSSSYSTEISSAKLKSESGFYYGSYGEDRSFVRQGSISTDTVSITVSNGTVTLLDGDDHSVYQGEELAIVPQAEATDGTTLLTDDSAGGRSYSGGFKFTGNDNVLTVVNYVDIEDYVMGVIPYEMSASWETEALKAQALCARTYAVSHFDACASQGFDISNTTAFQVYYGVYTGTGRSNVETAVTATAGQYILYDNSPINAVFHARDGGATEDSENVWTSALPYLRGITDTYEKEHLTTQSVTLTSSEIYTLMCSKDSSFSTKLSDVSYIDVTYTDMGNVLSITFIDSQGNNISYSKESCRITVLSALFAGTNYSTSQRFTITAVEGDSSAASANNALSSQGTGIQVVQLSSVTTADSMDSTPAVPAETATSAEPEPAASTVAEEPDEATKAPETASEPQESTAPNAAASPSKIPAAASETAVEDPNGDETLPSSGLTYSITNYGYGHNVGMSQWGAQYMAQEGCTYDEIIHFYYTDVTISNFLPFEDVVQSDWFYNAVLYVYENNIFAGTDATHFDPESPMERGQLVTILGKMSGIVAEEYTGNGGFSDVETGEYYTPFVDWAKTSGVVAGFDDGTFRPEDPITREDLCVIFLQYGNSMGVTFSTTREKVTFADDAQISGYAKEAVSTLQQAGLISGVGGNRMDPQANCLRSEVASITKSYREM